MTDIVIAGLIFIAFGAGWSCGALWESALELKRKIERLEKAVPVESLGREA